MPAMLSNVRMAFWHPACACKKMYQYGLILAVLIHLFNLLTEEYIRD